MQSAAVAEPAKPPVDENVTVTKNEGPEPGIGGLSAPGKDAVMTPDMLLVSPKQGGQTPPQPLKAYVGNNLKLDILRYDVKYGGLEGILISVTNDTNRPVVIDGNKAVTVSGGDSKDALTAASIDILQQEVTPNHKQSDALVSVLRDIIPAAITIGAYPTYRDYKQLKKPINERYGPDELRRRLEASRFGRRILWPQQKSTGVFYFKTEQELKGLGVDVPVSTLYDANDSGDLASQAVTAASASPTPTQGGAELRGPIEHNSNRKILRSTTTDTPGYDKHYYDAPKP